MKIGLVGGIYGMKGQLRETLQITPEIVLERELKARGHEVHTFGHYDEIPTQDLDVVHVHHLGFGAIRMAADSSDVPFVYTSHDGLAMSGRLGFLRRTGASFVMSSADAVVALSSQEASFQQQAYSLRGAVHTVIPNGIRCNLFRYCRKNYAGRGRPWQLLFVGQLVQEKRVDVLLHALTLLGMPVELTLVYHTAGLEAFLREMTNNLGLAERVHFLGPRAPENLCAIYQSADLLVLPSAGEALPSVITEALLCGTPVVATDVGGVREQVGPQGAVVPPDDTKAFAAAIGSVLGNYDWYAGRSKQVSETLQARYSIEGMAHAHVELYDKVLRVRGMRRRHAGFKMPVSRVLKMGVALYCATK
jgi:glycosyltransferase involved in cell wall biosynthesis